jgi:phage repressor protein C with HTH and peptisase S24 domain
MQIDRRGWQISDRLCAWSDQERHLAHIVKLGDRWFASDSTHSSGESGGFLFLGSFAGKEAAMDAAEDAVSLKRIHGASPLPAAIPLREIPKIFHFRTHLPLYSLAAAAGRFGEQQREINPEGWVEVPPGHIMITSDMFVTHIEGDSMTPMIPDGSLCAFRSNVSTPYNGKILLIEDYGDVGGNRYAVKRYRTSVHADRNKEGDGAWLHERITLESINPAEAPWEVPSAKKINVIGEFVFTVPRAPAQLL